jgi:hypothetical protein
MLALALGALACDGASGPSGGAAPAQGEQAEKRLHHFRLLGPLPWNKTVYYAIDDAIDAAAPYVGAIVGDNRVFVLSAPAEARFHIRSERLSTEAERRMLWMVDSRGTLGDGVSDTNIPIAEIEEIRDVTAPERAVVTLTAPAGSGGPDALTFYDEETGTCATAYRDPRHAYFLAVWDADTANAYRNVAPPRPWKLEDIAPGTYVVGAVTAGRQWTARRVEIGPRKPLEIDAGAAPAGGGTVVCEDSRALLLLNGELAIPAPRITAALAYRSTWKNVPPGSHKVRYPDGREVDVDVVEGETTKIGR